MNMGWGPEPMVRDRGLISLRLGIEDALMVSFWVQ